MRFTVPVTIEMTDEQMRAWAALHGVEATEEAILADLWGRDFDTLLNGTHGHIKGIDVTGIALS